MIAPMPRKACREAVKHASMHAFSYCMNGGLLRTMFVQAEKLDPMGGRNKLIDNPRQYPLRIQLKLSASCFWLLAKRDIENLFSRSIVNFFFLEFLGKNVTFFLTENERVELSHHKMSRNGALRTPFYRDTGLPLSSKTRFQRGGDRAQVYSARRIHSSSQTFGLFFL